MMTSCSSSGDGLNRLRRGLSSIGVASFSLCVSFCPMPIFAQDLSFKDFPFLIYCEVQGIDKAFYFSKLETDGVAFYLTPDRQAGTITIDGAAHRVGGDQSGTCAGKTLDDLRTSGQAYDLSK